ncbi:MAG: hypothetical protein IPO90_09935 [Flavobacteriales bacterium]|nr:hypothetical protein [Flavobacteriales bacterium]
MNLDQEVLPWVLRLHGASGALALFVAPMAMFVYKGGLWHRRWGKIFFYSMILVCATAIIMAVAVPRNFWLALVAVFSFHMVASGYRSLYLKKLHEGLKPERLDKWLHGVAGVFSGGLLIWGLSHLFMGVRNTQAILFTTFGFIGMGMVAMNFGKFFKRKHDKREWFFGHITGMLGGYIATVSAFSAVNFGNWFPWMPAWLVWLWPTLIGAPLIALWSTFYRKKFAKGTRIREMAEVRIR